jgi:hypothetical protein
MSDLPLIFFDVNETLLDLQTMAPTFERIFEDKSAMRLEGRSARHGCRSFCARREGRQHRRPYSRLSLSTRRPLARGLQRMDAHGLPWIGPSVPKTS